MPSLKGSGSARPSKSMSWLGIIVGGGMIVTVVLFFVSPALAAISFVTLWIVTVLSIIGYHVKNATSDEGVAHSRFSFSAETGSTEERSSDGGDFDERLRDLEQLRKDGLITQDEYNRKRSDILNEDW